MKNFGIAICYSDNGCDIYYGYKSIILNKLITTPKRAYGTFFDTDREMMDQVEYLEKEKADARIHKLEQIEIA